MSYYDYLCPKCGHKLYDVYKRIVEDTSTHECPKCKSQMKIYFKSPPSFELKGKGWYKTDYKSKK